MAGFAVGFDVFVPKYVMSCVGLILANPGSDDANDTAEASHPLDEPVKALDLQGVTSDFHEWNQFLKNRRVTVSDHSVCDSRLTREDALERIWGLFRVFAHNYLVIYLGHGRKGSGNWEMRDNAVVTLLDIESAWLQLGYVRHLKNTATIVCDSCYSGKWPLFATSLQIPGLQIQSAVDGDTLARDSCPTFSHIFLQMQEGQKFPEQFLHRWKPLCFSAAADCTAGGPLHLVGAERTASQLYLQQLYNGFGGQLVNISLSQPLSHDGSVFHEAIAEVQGSQVGKMVVEKAQHDPVPFITQIECSLKANVASCLLLVMLRYLNVEELHEELHIVFEKSNEGLVDFLLAHGFKPFYFPNLPSGQIRAGCRVLCPKKVGIAWNEVEFVEGAKTLFEGAKTLFVESFQQAYDKFSEADLGLEGITKDEWLHKTIDSEETLRSSCPERYPWLVAYDQSNARQVLGVAIVDLRPEEAPHCCYVRQIAVCKDGQGRGIGKALVKAILDHCSSIRIFEFLAVTRQINLSSLRFMAKLGFQKCESKKRGYGEKYIELKARIEPGSSISSPSGPSAIGPTVEQKHRACSKSENVPERTKDKDNLKLELMAFLWNAERTYVSAKNLLVVAFLEAYAAFSEDELGLQVSKREWLEETAANEMNIKEKDPNRYQWLIASRADALVGLMVLDIGCDGIHHACPTDATIRQLAILPKFQRQRLGLAQEFGLQVLRHYPSICRLKASTRCQNQAAQYLLKKFGFHLLAEDNPEFPARHYLTYVRDLTVPAQPQSRKSMHNRSSASDCWKRMQHSAKQMIST